MFRLKDSEDNFLGEPMTAFIKVNAPQVNIDQAMSQPDDTEDFTKYNLNDE